MSSTEKPSSSASQPADVSKSDSSSISGTKARILTHMNKDHQLALYDYLNYYLNRNEFNPEDPKTSVEIVDIDASSILLKYTYPGSPNKQLAKLPINPPMRDDSLKDARQALVGMARNAAESRGYAVFQILEWRPLGAGPTAPRDCFVFALALSLVVPHLRSFIYSTLATSVLGWANPAHDAVEWSPVMGPIIGFVQNWPWAPLILMYTVHIAEAFTVMAAKVRKYRVPKPQKYCWILSTIVEGFPALLRFNRLVSDVEGKH